jgi:hypothetical protein
LDQNQEQQNDSTENHQHAEDETNPTRPKTIIHKLGHLVMGAKTRRQKLLRPTSSVSKTSIYLYKWQDSQLEGGLHRG